MLKDSDDEKESEDGAGSDTTMTGTSVRDAIRRGAKQGKARGRDTQPVRNTNMASNKKRTPTTPSVKATAKGSGKSGGS